MVAINKRAVSPKQKEQRYLQIMDVTNELFHHHTYHEITLTKIAEKLGWSRGNLYKYVDTKEEIFLSLYLRKQRKFIDDFNQKLKDNIIISNELFAETMAYAFNQNMEYLEYHSIMTTILETNVSVEKLANFKRQSYQDRKIIFQYLARQRQFKDDNQLIQFYLTILYHGCGLYAMVEYSDIYVKAMELASLPVQKVDFIAEYQSFILMCLKQYPSK